MSLRDEIAETIASHFYRRGHEPCGEEYMRAADAVLAHLRALVVEAGPEPPGYVKDWLVAGAKDWSYMSPEGFYAIQHRVNNWGALIAALAAARAENERLMAIVATCGTDYEATARLVRRLQDRDERAEKAERERDELRAQIKEAISIGEVWCADEDDRDGVECVCDMLGALRVTK